MAPTATDWAYLAGIIDGEGCLGIIKFTGQGSVNPSHVISVYVGNTDPRMLVWIVEKFGGSVRSRKRTDKRGAIKEHRPFYEWALYAVKAERIVRGCLPYLVTKREQAELLLKLRATYGHVPVRMEVPMVFRSGGRFVRTGLRRFQPKEVIEARDDIKQQLHSMKREIVPLVLSQN